MESRAELMSSGTSLSTEIPTLWQQIVSFTKTNLICYTGENPGISETCTLSLRQKSEREREGRSEKSSTNCKSTTTCMKTENS